jgi:hypothetical protein
VDNSNRKDDKADALPDYKRKPPDNISRTRFKKVANSLYEGLVIEHKE